MLYVDPFFGKNLSLSAKIQKEADFLNEETIGFWYRYLMELALNRYEWDDLPDEIDQRFIELCLTYNGSCLFYYDDILGQYLALEYSSYGPMTYYRDPIHRSGFTSGYAYNEYAEEWDRIDYLDLTPENSVIIWNNSTRSGDIGAIYYFAQKLTEIDRAHDVNIRGQKTPKIITTTRDKQLTMENLLRKYDGNVPFIFGNKVIDPINDINVLDTSTPYLLDKLTLEHKSMLARAHTYFGIENASTDKKERQVTDEVISNLGGVAIRRYAGLKPRREACKKIARIFPIQEPRVKFSQDDIMTLAATEPEQSGENPIEMEGGYNE